MGIGAIVHFGKCQRADCDVADVTKRDRCEGTLGLVGIDPGPTKAIKGWHKQDWQYTRAFVDAHAEYQKVIEEGTRNAQGYSFHYRIEMLGNYPYDTLNGTTGTHNVYQCVIIRGDGWQKDTLPADVVETQLTALAGRSSYEDCVADSALPDPCP